MTWIKPSFDLPLRQVVHRKSACHKRVTKMLMFSVFCCVVKLLLSENNSLIMCLKIGQINEAGRKQGKFPDALKLLSDLSTGMVDALALASRHAALQHRERIS
ncbi:hypothetical protein [Rhodalgimonas zhirmunskyi]|uniref:Uncharacterized protein n=1 Tax=Rhodalgimonas zhirmunskyi TaxID=2964767 RepID=A0AAJ1X4Z3_9RHOB|nr:hypothetical protein [Rhodoalgimonas zhirmunskyi]MDQ2094733.1 hypothetical protein [Rhodoalgimonas zhirmunskyi]